MIEMLERSAAVDAVGAYRGDSRIDLRNGRCDNGGAPFSDAPRSGLGNGFFASVPIDVLAAVGTDILSVGFPIGAHVLPLTRQGAVPIGGFSCSFVLQFAGQTPREDAVRPSLVADKRRMRLGGFAARTRFHAVSVTRKGNALPLAGYRLLRFHGDQVRSGEATSTIKKALAGLSSTSGGEGGRMTDHDDSGYVQRLEAELAAIREAVGAQPDETTLRAVQDMLIEWRHYVDQANRLAADLDAARAEAAAWHRACLTTRGTTCRICCGTWTGDPDFTESEGHHGWCPVGRLLAARTDAAAEGPGGEGA